MDATTCDGSRAGVTILLVAALGATCASWRSSAPPPSPVHVDSDPVHVDSDPPREVRWASMFIAIPQVNHRWAMEVRARFDTQCEAGTQRRIFVGLSGSIESTVHVETTRHEFHVVRVEQQAEQSVVLVDGFAVARVELAEGFDLDFGSECSVGDQNRFPDSPAVDVDYVAYEFERLPCVRCRRGPHGTGWGCGGLDMEASCSGGFASQRLDMFVDGTDVGLASMPKVTTTSSGLTRVTFGPVAKLPMQAPSFDMHFDDLGITGDFMIDEALE